MLNVHPGAAFVGRIEVQPGEFRAKRAIGCPPGQSFSFIVQIAVVVRIPGEPDVVVDAAVAVFDDIDVPFVIDGEIVGTRERQSDRRSVARSIVLLLANAEIVWFARSSRYTSLVV